MENIYFYNGIFYSDALQKDIPEQAVKITRARWIELQNGKTKGKRIVTAPDGSPELADLPAPPRAVLVEDLKQRIDQKTDATILTGFRYDATAFKLSGENQQNFGALEYIRNEITYPLRIKSLDGYYDFDNAANYHLFYLAGLAFVQETLRDGWAKKDAIDQLTDVELYNLWSNNEQ